MLATVLVDSSEQRADIAVSTITEALHVRAFNQRSLLVAYVEWWSINVLTIRSRYMGVERKKERSDSPHNIANDIKT